MVSSASQAAELLGLLWEAAAWRDPDDLADLLGEPYGQPLPGKGTKPSPLALLVGPPWSPQTGLLVSARTMPPVLVAETFDDLRDPRTRTHVARGTYGSFSAKRGEDLAGKRIASSTRRAQQKVGLLGPREWVPDSPAGAHALAAAALTARSVADAAEQAARRTDERSARRLRGEARAYRAFADAQEANLPAATSWVPEVTHLLRQAAPEPQPFPTVPAQPYGHAALGPYSPFR